MCKLGAALVAALLGSAAPAIGAMSIVITPDAGLAANPAAMAAFNRAGQAWCSHFSNNITINISAGLSSNFANPNVIGSTSAAKFQSPYDFFPRMATDVGGEDPNDSIVNSVPDLAHFSATLPSGITFGGKFITTKANFKALGFGDLIDLDQVYGANDATITFNSNFAFDYDSSDGVTPGKIDFQTVATHELGHALGFLSAVDTVDALKSAGTTTNDLAIAPLDLFRFQNNLAGKDPASTTDFTNDPRYLDTGGNAIFDDLLLERALSTGRSTGDGLEASHWKDDVLTGQLLGVMDPSINGSIVESITANDIRALDLIGYDVVVPEPTLLIAGLIPLVLLTRAPRRKVHRERFTPRS